MSPEYITTEGLTPYPDALAAMEQRVTDILDGKAPELLWFLQHPPLYTSGTSAKQADMLGNMPFPVYDAGRGGQWTYHGPGQRICYLMLDLKARQMMDLRAYVQMLEQWVINTLARFGVEAFTREGRIGVWVNQRAGIRSQGSEFLLDKNGRPVGRPSLERASCDLQEQIAEAKIAALGIRVRKWVTFHGIALNVNPDLSHYAGIVPCGISEFGVTSLHDLGITVSMENVDGVLKEEFNRLFSTSISSLSKQY
ncbi:MAG: lipoyl(octanoyl) transferase LipB [Alphaproteobacteria bacterium]